MAGKIKIIFTIFLLSAVFISGCGRSASQEQKEIPVTRSEQERSRLQSRIDQRFENPQAHYQLGKNYQRDGLWSQAQYSFERAITFDPANRDAQAALVAVLLASGDTRTADARSDTYISNVSGSAEESFKLGMGFQKERLDELALTCYQQALRLAPNSAKINRQIGYYYLSKQDGARAGEYLYRSYQLNRNQPDVAGELGRLGIDVTGAITSSSETKRIDKN
ncbi:MAG: hypothetical protein WCZ89_02370 [Phycisphaerae bacterium]